MPQINVEFDEEVVRNLDRIAAKQSIRRSDLLRRTARELIEAEATGREPFTLVVEEMTAKDISEVIANQRTLGDDLDQMLKANRKREADLYKSEMALQRLIALHEADTIAARERGQREAEQALEEGLIPFRAEIAALRKDLEAAQASDPRMDAIEVELAELKKLAAQPRTQRNLVLGDDRMLSFRFLSGMGLIALILGGILSLILVAEIPSWGVVASSRSLDGDAGICRLLEYRYAVQDCQVPTANRIDRTPPAPISKTKASRKSERR